MSPSRDEGLNDVCPLTACGDSPSRREGNYVYNTVESYSYEKEGILRDAPFDPSNSYIAVQIGDEANQPLPIPEDDREAESMMDEICAGSIVIPAIRKRMLSMLKFGILTPNLANGMIGKRKADVA